MEESAGYHQATATVKPVRVPPMPCPTCGTVETPVLQPGTGPHVGKAVSACCQRFIRWIPKALVQGKEGATVGGINRVLLVGTISQYGVSVRYSASGSPCASFTLLLAEQGQDGKEHRLFVECEVWGKKAEAASDLEAGQLALFEGKLAKRKKGEQWDWVVAGVDVTPLLAPVHASLTGSSN